ncbi:hypothetical protein TorRG33x02_326070 [Trema orientale]|uniref:Uncharacterized protein n=1 Tax=Trema orientale TaxID=63057 RepID=A0A2P5BC49_TREOI|nr:hypothetical protein TorRG33x02_326070 [Trema orientale]
MGYILESPIKSHRINVHGTNGYELLCFERKKDYTSMFNPQRKIIF